MLKVGDTVKVIAQDKEILPFNTIGYIGKIIEIDKINNYKLDNDWWYGEKQLEKGYLEWAKEIIN